MISVKLAVGVGYEFTITTSDMVNGIALKRTEKLVSVNGEIYTLYKGLDYEDSAKIDAIMDAPNHPPIYKIDAHIVR